MKFWKLFIELGLVWTCIHLLDCRGEHGSVLGLDPPSDPKESGPLKFHPIPTVINAKTVWDCIAGFWAGLGPVGSGWGLNPTNLMQTKSNMDTSKESKISPKNIEYKLGS